MIKRKVYIAGPMSGLPDCNRGAFHLAADVHRALGHIVLNPATLPAGLAEHEYMQICTAMLMCCDEIYLLDGWQQSDGAKAELAMAQKLDFKIVYQEGIDHEITLRGLSA
ncbi:DUF4406 domain-containing protein [Shewanella sp. MBTL60-007]|uniref:DUF4406 domain-containing protein n=1 Tax=Shewanella sp. MBTL60-007 TaxID=2815911 RepID=UPI001BC47F5A|nr:DUF4406 domain-containing protein [Shewanella sp. MBTL60-007]GIU22191.1 hypothetical protein TUM3792_24000 [Shewanella sp. MBTL60-007]